MRLEMTMSDSGPVPRNHSPLVCDRLSKFIRGFLLSNQIPQVGGFLVGFVFHGQPQTVAQLDELGVAASSPTPPRNLPCVFQGPVDALQQWLQAGAKDLVVVRTAETAFRAKLHILY